MGHETHQNDSVGRVTQEKILGSSTVTPPAELPTKELATARQTDPGTNLR